MMTIKVQGTTIESMNKTSDLCFKVQLLYVHLYKIVIEWLEIFV